MTNPQRQSVEHAIFVLGLDHVQLAMPPGREGAARHFYRTILGLREIARFRWDVLMSGTLRRDSFEGRDRDAVLSMWQRGIHEGRSGSSGTPALPV